MDEIVRDEIVRDEVERILEKVNDKYIDFYNTVKALDAESDCLAGFSEGVQELLEEMAT